MTKQPKCKALLDHLGPRFGKVCDGVDEVSVPQTSRSSAPPMLRLTVPTWSQRFRDVTSRELRLITRVSTCKFVEWVASHGAHEYDGDWRSKNVVTLGKNQGRCGP